MSRGVSIQYGDVAVGAKENFDLSTENARFGTLSNLKKNARLLTNYATPCDYYSTLLNGETTALPHGEKPNTGLWSETQTGTNYGFAEPVVLELTSNGLYSSPGFTLTFDKFNNIYCTAMMIEWYRVIDGVSTKLGFQLYQPDSSFYYCEQRMENFNRVVMSFYDMNMPNTRLKLESIDYGHGVIFESDELRSVSLNEQIDPISSRISISTCNFTLDSKSELPYSFQTKQPLTVYFNDKLISTQFVKKATRRSKTLYNINAEDYIGILEDTNFYGGFYGCNASQILDDIFKAANVPYELDSNYFTDRRLDGYIPYGNCREALQQVCFACNCTVVTSGFSIVKVCDAIAAGSTQEVPQERIMQGITFTDDDPITSIQLTAHKYTPDTEEMEAYNAKRSGTGKGIFVVFSEPLWSLEITGGTIENSTTNTATINATSESCILTGKRFKHDTIVKELTEKNISANAVKNVRTITSATLVSSSNVDDVLENCYNWLTRRKSTKAKIVEGKTVTYGKLIKWGELPWGTFKWGDNHPDIIKYDDPVGLGDTISVNSDYLGKVEGVLVSQSYNLNGNIIVKQVELK